MPLLAFTTFAILRAPLGDAQVQGFFDRLPAAFGAADAAEGFVDRSSRDPVTLKHAWGDYVPARFFDPARHVGVVFTLSRWRTLEAVHAYAYAGVHGEALRHRLEWFEKPEWPSYAAWWVADDHRPDWVEAKQRLEYLHDHGPSEVAFDLRAPRGPDGAPVTIDRQAARAIVERADPARHDQAAREREVDAITRVMQAGQKPAG
jgi:hypothetical protein